VASFRSSWTDGFVVDVVAGVAVVDADIAVLGSGGTDGCPGLELHSDLQEGQMSPVPRDTQLAFGTSSEFQP
jgi:hypothetical protein